MVLSFRLTFENISISAKKKRFSSRSKTVEGHEKQNIFTFRNNWPYGSHWPTSWFKKSNKGSQNNENLKITLTKISMVLHSALRCTCARISPLGLKNVPTSA